MGKLTFHGHACFTIEVGGTSILIDPWLSGNPEVGHIPDIVQPDLILVTHNHGDHAGDAVELSRRFGAPIVATPALARHYSGEGAETLSMHVGGRRRFEWGSVKAVQAIHDSPLSVGQSWRVDLAAPCGFIVEADGRRLYHAGDTCLMMDMKLFAPIDIAMLPIDGLMVMEPEDAVIAAEFLDAGLVIPMHWRQQDPNAFVELLEESGRSGRVLAKAESFEF